MYTSLENYGAAALSMIWKCFYRIKMINEQYKLLGRKVADLRQEDDFYPTPAYVTQALLDNYRFTGEIWEPACGDGRMSKILEQYYSKVESSDLINRGYGTAGVDFWRLRAKLTTSSPIRRSILLLNLLFRGCGYPEDVWHCCCRYVI